MHLEKIEIKLPFWKQALIKANQAARCNAKTRIAGRCQSPAMLNGRCRMHGGKSPGAPCGDKHGRYKNGYYTKAALKERQQVSQLIKEVKATLKNLEVID